MIEDINFKTALKLTKGFEGTGESNDKLDPGGQTYVGISRVYWPNLPLWVKIDNWVLAGKPPIDLSSDVEEFYYNNFWCRFQGDKVAEVSPLIAYELFDTSVNVGIFQAVKFFQTALNMQNVNQSVYQDIEVDGKFGLKTIETLKRYFASSHGAKEQNEKILLNCMNGEQYIYYKNNPKHEYFRGWFTRV